MESSKTSMHLSRNIFILPAPFIYFPYVVQENT
jgi:hypothetical protein